MSSPSIPDTAITAAALARMGRHPQPFVLKLDTQNGVAATVSCEEVVRAIPGKRLVCRGSWQGRAVYTKVYLGNAKYWQAECRGLQALHDHSIAAPQVLHAGTADLGALHVIILAAIEPARTLAVEWAQASDEAARLQLLSQAVVTIAHHHQAGLEQQDIHLNNFLLAGERLYTLDGGGIRRIGKGVLSLVRSRDNLARFLAQLYPRFDALVETVLPDYIDARDWPADRLLLDPLLARVRLYRRERRRHFLKKIFRDCSEFVCRKHWGSFQVYDRALESEALQQLLADPDASLQQPDMRYLKQGNTCTLWTVTVDGRPLVVKRYNIKGFRHRIGRTWRRTRAAVSWKNAHRLAMYGILGARPVALCERRFGPLRGRAWLVMDYLEGDDILQLCEQPRAEHVPGVISATIVLLGQLAQCRISHGDMKGSNFIQSPQGVAVIDLDAMREYESDVRFRYAQQRDLRRFVRNWQDCPEIEAGFREAMQANRLTADR